MATALVGSGVFLLPASLAAFGSASLLAWVLTSTGALLLALVFARRGRAYPKTVDREPACPALLEAGEKARLLVVGPRGMGEIRGLLPGSVSQAMVHQAPCPGNVTAERLLRPGLDTHETGVHTSTGGSAMAAG